LQLNSSNVSGHVYSSTSRLAGGKPADEIFQLDQTTSAVRAVSAIKVVCLTETLQSTAGWLCLLHRPHTLLVVAKVSCSWNPSTPHSPHTNTHTGRNSVAGGEANW